MVRKGDKRGPGCIFPNYKWCGPGCSGPGKPINDVDACCERHDRCLRKGIPPCICDSELIRCLSNKVDFRTEKGKTAALMYHAMKLKKLFTC